MDVIVSVRSPQAKQEAASRGIRAHDGIRWKAVSFSFPRVVETLAMSIICEGCGRPVPIPEGYRRGKIQCTCGVICPVPESARQQVADTPTPKRSAPAARSSPTVEEEAASAPPAFRDPEPDKKTAPAKRAAVEMRFNCRRCGQLVRRQGECPSCDADKMPAAAKEEPVWWPAVDAPGAKEDEEEDSSPYIVEGADEVQCPQCTFMLPPGSVLCVRCGFHLKKRKKIVKTYQPIERVWETNAALQARLTVFGTCQLLSLALGVLGVFWGGADLGVFIGAFLGFTAMMSFLLGTFDRIHLTRDARGRARLTKTWRVCFFARPPKSIDVRGFEGIVSGRHRDVTSAEYWIFFFLLFMGLIPGIIWWYLAIHKVTYHVSLCRDHGFPEQIVYSGWSENQMKEVAYTLRDATGLRYDEG
jgi:hypothetical protein